MLRLCTICARGGSKGVPGKNIRLLAGKPLIAHTIEHAKQSKLFDAVAVSSDSDDILKAAKNHGADYIIKRPDDLASDTAGKVPAIAHAMREAEKQSGKRYDILVDLDATSPLRIADDIVGAVQLLEETGCNSVITATPAHRSPYFNLVERKDDGSVALSKQLPDTVLRRQDSPDCFDMNASIYVWQRNAILGDKPSVFYEDTKLYVMPRERSFDIDEELDFKIVELIMRERETPADVVKHTL
jgi:N-acylneuraminate cytidylyltransferase/CMP-N,N'-diacetyllegionaminic acid synthase